jgi:hypothetical protein
MQMRRATCCLVVLALVLPYSLASQAKERVTKGKKKSGAPTALPAARTAPDELACKKDADCVFLPSICPRCPPCTPTWRPVGNRAALKRIRRMQAIVDCAAPACRKCKAAWLGKKPICLKGRCAVKGKAAAKGKTVGKLEIDGKPEGRSGGDKCYKDCLKRSSMQAVSWQAIQAQCRRTCKQLGASQPKPPRLPWSRDRVCTSDKDCRILPTICRSCAPCKPTWRPVGNHQAAARIMKKKARIRCPKVKCKRCGDGANLLGTRAVCVRRQCEVRP